VAVSLLALALLLDARSRPEALSLLETVALVVLLARPGARGLQSRRNAIVAGLIFAALFVTQPTIFGLSGVAFCLFALVSYLLAEVDSRQLLAFAVVAGASFLVGFLFLTWMCFGGSPNDWLTGIWRSAKLTTDRQNIDSWTKALLANRYLQGVGISFGFLAALFLVVWRALSGAPEYSRMRSKLVFVVAAATFGWFLYYFALRLAPAYYNFTGMLVATAMAALLLSGEKTWERRIIDVLLALLGLSAAAGAALWGIQTASERIAMNQTRSALALAITADADHGLRVCADSAALPAIDDPHLAQSLIVSVPFGKAPLPPDPMLCDVYYLMQTQHPLLLDQNAQAPLIDGFRPESLNFRPFALSFAKIRPVHLGFARYLRNAS
jgi:hypothetical protein